MVATPQMHRVLRLTEEGPENTLETDDLLATYMLEYDPEDNGTLKQALIDLYTKIPNDRLWEKIILYEHQGKGYITIEGIKKKVFTESKEG